EPWVIEQVLDIALRSGEEVVNAEHFVAVLQQPLAQMRAEESGAAGDQDALAGVVVAHSGPWLLFEKSRNYTGESGIRSRFAHLRHSRGSNCSLLVAFQQFLQLSCDVHPVPC